MPPVKRVIRRVAIALGALLLLAAAALGVFVWIQVSRFDASLEKVYPVALTPLQRSTDAAVLARGRHLSEAIAPCSGRDCHGADLGGGQRIDLGPLGMMTGPNISAGGLGAAYSDAELARLIRHGIKKDGRSVRFMPSQDFSWLPDSDVSAVIAYVRSLPPVNRPNGINDFKPLVKVLDRMDKFTVDVARHIDHDHVGDGPPPTPTAVYGAYLARLCIGCHGKNLSGGPIPGAPPSLPVPTNLTPDETGLKGWTLDDFTHTLATGIDKKGKKLASMMPVESFGKLDETERTALWAYLQSLPARKFGGR